MRVIQNPQELKDWILQCLNTCPGLLAEGGPFVGNVLIKSSPKRTNTHNSSQQQHFPKPKTSQAIPSSSTSEDQTTQEHPIIIAESASRSVSPRSQVSEEPESDTVLGEVIGET